LCAEDCEPFRYLCQANTLLAAIPLADERTFRRDIVLSLIALFPILRFTSEGHPGLSVAILHSSSNIKESETNLEENQCVRAVMNTPQNPEYIADQENPESPVTLELALRSYQPCS